MKEGLRSSTLSKRGKERGDLGRQNVAGGGRKGLILNPRELALFNDSSPYSLRSRGQKERGSECLECDHNAGAGSESNADVVEKGFSVISNGLESAQDLVTTSERIVEECGIYEQVTCNNDADHGAKEESESSLVPNGLDSEVRKEIRLSNLSPNHSRTSLENEKDSEVDADVDACVCLNSMNGDGVVFSNGDEEKAFSSIAGNSLLDNESENADVYLDVAKTRQEHGNDSQGLKKDDVNCPRQDNVVVSDVDKVDIGSSLNLKNQESAHDLIVYLVKGNSERSANKDVVCMENGDDELAVILNYATAVAEKGEIVDSQMEDDSAANKCLKEEKVSPPASIVLDSAQDLAFFNTDINVEATSGSQHMECLKDADMDDDEVTVTDIDVKSNGVSDDEGMVILVKSKRGRKRKREGISESNKDEESGKKKVNEGKPQFTARVLRPRTAIIGGDNQEVDSGSNGCVLGEKRKMKIECPDQDELHVKIDETDQQTQKPGKKLKCRGRPPKVQEEYLPTTLLHEKEMKDTMVSSEVKLRGRPPMVKKDLSPSKVINENILKQTVSEVRKRRGRPPKVLEEKASHVIHKSVINENNLKHTVSEVLKRRGRPPKVLEEKASHVIHKSVINENNLKHTVSEVLKRRGRPPKVLEEKASHVIHESKLNAMVVSTKLKRRGRPPKVLGKDLASQVMHKNKLKDMVRRNKLRNLMPKKVNVEGIIEISNEEVRKENGISEVNNDKRRKIKGSEKSFDQTEIKDASIGNNAGKSIVKKEPQGEVEMSRSEQKKLVRDQINSMIYAAGWTIDYRLRQSKNYQDAVYVDSEGKTHWSSTKAYRCLKKRIEDEVANAREIAAFYVIPDEAFSTLFRHTDKERPSKGKKGKKLGKKDAGQTVKGTTGKDKKLNKLSKKGKNVSKKAKLKGYKSLSKKSKPRLLARSSKKGSNQDGGGKRSLLSWMIDLGTILPGWKVHYGSGRRKKIRCEGIVNRDGIHCGCCEEIMCISDFGAHANGGGKILGQPSKNIFLESGTSLWQCMLDSWRKEEESRRIIFNSVDVSGDDPNDDTCNICGDGGELLCCDGCPSTFHESCLDIQNSPSGKWHCLYCSCKFCGMAAVNTPPTDDCPEPIVSELLSCNLCEEKFHQPCSQGEEAVDVASGRASFCGRKCWEISEKLQMYIGVRHELLDGFSWTLLQCSDVSHDQSADSDVDARKVELNSKLAVAFSIMDECFVPIIDERSSINIIQNVVYNCGSNFRRMNFGSFCTAILERGDEIISAASIRIHGNQVAEMPFIGTRDMYRRQGMCRRLLNAIESALGYLDVEKLVIPAISELFQTWTSVFGFKPLDKCKRQELKRMSLMVFPGTDMLEKPLLNLTLAEGNTIKATELGAEHQIVSSASSDSNAFSKLIDGDSSLHLSDELLNDTPKHTNHSLTSDDNPLKVPKDCSYDNGHSIPTNVNTSTKAQSGCATLVPDDISMECNPEVNHPSNYEVDNKLSIATNSEQRPIELPEKCEEATDMEVTKEVGNLVNSEHTSEPCSLASVTGELSKSVEVQLGVDNDGIMEVKSPSLICSVGSNLELTSEGAIKVTFDLNKDFVEAETDSDLAAGDSLPIGSQQSAKAYEHSDSGPQVDKPAGNLCDSDPCTTQALVLV